MRAIGFQKPDRIPLCIDYFGPHAMCAQVQAAALARFEPDILTVRNADAAFVPDAQGRDEWGCIWSTFGDTMGEVIGHPLADWENLDAWVKTTPDFAKLSRYEAAREVIAARPDRFYMGGLGFMMMHLINFRGYSEYMMDFYDAPDELLTVIDVLYKKGREATARYAEIGCHAVIGWEDWGLQTSLMIAPNLWRRFFKQKMGDFIADIHQHNMVYILHSCGYIADIIEDLIEIGVDVLQLDQQSNMGLDYLSRYAGRVAFACPADIQHSSEWDADTMHRYVAQMAHTLATPEGGLIYKAYSQPWSVGLTQEQCLAECAAFADFRF